MLTCDPTVKLCTWSDNPSFGASNPVRGGENGGECWEPRLVLSCSPVSYVAPWITWRCWSEPTSIWQCCRTTASAVKVRFEFCYIQTHNGIRRRFRQARDVCFPGCSSTSPNISNSIHSKLSYDQGAQTDRGNAVGCAVSSCDLSTFPVITTKLKTIIEAPVSVRPFKEEFVQSGPQRAQAQRLKEIT